MRQTIRTMLCIAGAFALFSCAKEIEQPVSPEQQVNPQEGTTLLTLTAVGEELDTKTALSGTSTVWSEGDQIKVFFSDADPVSFTLDAEDAGKTSGKFTGYVPNGKTPIYAVYPASATSSVSGTTVNVAIPDTQPGTFTAGNVAVAKVGAGNTLNFKNINAFLVFQLKAGSGVTKVEVTSVDGGALSGTVPVDCSDETPTPGTATGTASTVSMTTSGEGTYYMSVVKSASNHTKGLKMTYYTGTDPSYTETGVYYLNRNMGIAANNMYTFGEVETDKNYYVTVSGAGSHNGMNWANAFSKDEMWKRVTLTLAQESDSATKDAKLDAIDGATFLLASGTYAMGEEKALNLDEGSTIALTFQGGYNASTGARDIASNVTSFSGEDSYRILTLGGDMDVTFDGISFVDGHVDGDGGAVNVSGGTWSFNACTFSGNTATNGGAMELGGSSTVNISDCVFSNNTVTGSGGAIDSDMAATSITDCSFSDNTAAKGGAISFFNAGKRTIQGTSFSGNSSTAEGGAIYARYNIEAKECTFSGNQSVNGGAIFVYQSFRAQVYGCTFQENTASQNGGAISVDYNAKLTVADYHDTYSQFIGNTAKNDGGALYIYTSKPYGSTNDNNIINHSVFKGNNAIYNGGSIAVTSTASTTKVYISQCTFGGNVDGESNVANFGGAVYAEKDTFVNIGNSSFTGNRARNNGGAFCIEGDSYLNLFRDTFVGNYGQSGGAGYACNLDSKYPRLFIDECSFDANYISTHYGCLFNLNGIDNFCMHNSSVRGSYISASETGEKASWIDLDGVQGNVSISNSSIIGAASNSSLVWACNGSIYLTNSIIVQDNSSQKSIHGDNGATLDVNYTIYSAATTIATSTNNTSGKASGNLDGLSWSQDDSSYEGSAYYWKWDGTIGGAAPSMTTQSDVNTRVSGICQDFVNWSDSDFGKDQRNATRSSTWWPGAYQPDI